MSLLNEKGEIRVHNVMHTWVALSQRVSSYFDVVLAGKPAKEYSNSVFYALYGLFPKENSKKNLKEALMVFLRQVDSVAPPIMIL